MTDEQRQLLLRCWKLMEEAWPIEKTGSIWMEYKVTFSVIIATLMGIGVTEAQAIIGKE